MDSPLFGPFLVQTGTATEIATISLHEPQPGKTKIDPIDFIFLLEKANPLVVPKHLSDLKKTI